MSYSKIVPIGHLFSSPLLVSVFSVGFVQINVTFLKNKLAVIKGIIHPKIQFKKINYYLLTLMPIEILLLHKVYCET